MTSKFNRLSFLILMLFIIASCQSPTEIDTIRLIEYNYNIKDNLNVPQDTLDFGFLDKDAFDKKLFTIKNIKEETTKIKSIKMEKTPSYFFFDPLQNLNNLYLNPQGQNSLSLYLNVQQRNVGKFHDRIIIETDTIYYINVKSIVPDIMVKDFGKIELNIGETKEIEINILNYSNVLRTINGYSIESNPDNLVFSDNNYNNLWMYPQSNRKLKFKIEGKQQGTFYPIISIKVQNQISQKIIVKNECNLEVIVN